MTSPCSTTVKGRFRPYPAESFERHHRRGGARTLRGLARLLLAAWLALVPSSALLAAEPIITVMPTSMDRGVAAKISPLPVPRGLAALVLVQGLPEDAGLSGSFDGRPVFFSPARDGLASGFLAADVLLSPGHYPLTLTWRGGRREVDITVRDRSYGLRSITVPERQVNLSQAELDRAAREKKLTDAALATKSPLRLWRGPWTDPVGMQVSSSFGRQTRINGVLNPRPHAGIDLAASTGTPVKTPADGTVLLAGFHFFAGGSVYVDHGQGLVSVYFHLSEISVQAGDALKRGEVLGLAGATGRVTGAHLHYGIYLCGARIDPIAFHRLTSEFKFEALSSAGN